MSLKDKILAKKLKSKEITVDGEKIRIRELTGSERIEFGDLPKDVKARYCYLFLKAADTGEKLTEADFSSMFDLGFKEIDETVDAILELSEMKDSAAEEAEKN